MKVLVLLSTAGGGDRQPVIGLAVALDERGHDVTFLCDAATFRVVWLFFWSWVAGTLSFGVGPAGLSRRFRVARRPLSSPGPGGGGRC